MKRRPLALARGAALPRTGRAGRWEASGEAASDGGRGVEIWHLPPGDETVGDRLLALGARGIGGFAEGGLDDEGVWLVRRLPPLTLAERLRQDRGPWPHREALSLAASIARALAAAEEAALFPGAVTPEAVRVDGTRAVLAADALAGALVGGDPGAARAAATSPPLWTPPEQADGAVWDAAANRYALGLVLYRLLSGAHAFGGGGLRHALGEAAHREAAPFVDAVASALPGGLQSLTLRLLHPEAARRPARAAKIAEELEAFLDGGAARPKTRPEAGAPARGRERGREPERAAPVGRRSRPSADAGDAPAIVGAAPPSPPGDRAPRARSWSAGARALWPLGAGVVVAAGALSLLAAPPPPAPRPPTAIAAQAPLAAGETRAEDCASCHARQAAEWRRSVMAHAVKSPLFNALESLVEEQVGRDEDCPNGAGILRRAAPGRECRDRQSGLAITGSGGEHWCVNCHSPADNLGSTMPAWDGRPGGDARSRHPVRDLLGDRGIEGVSCGFCHQVHGPVGPRGGRAYQGNPTWTSFVTGQTFVARPEDGRGLFGIANSGYDLRPEEFLVGRLGAGDPGDGLDPRVHRRTPDAARAYLRSSEFCGSCHDVRLFGTDAIGAGKGEHFKRLRNAYSEWASWAKQEERQGRKAATCQGCHMSSYPGVCLPDDAPGAAAASAECPPGTRFVARAPGEGPSGRVAENSPEPSEVTTHYFSGVDLPLSNEFADALVDEPSLDVHGVPLSARRRRDLLLRASFRFGLGTARRGGQGIEIPLEVENIGAGHRVPAGFSQEREIWVHLTVRDGDGRVVYEVGRVDREDQDLRDKIMTRVSTNPDVTDARGRPEGLFGADVRDGPDVPEWDPPPALGGTTFRGKGLVNFQNGFLRCVRCIGQIDAQGRCQALPGQEAHRADRFADGLYDIDTGECRSNLVGMNALFETYFPIGALDATRGLPKGPDAIIDTRSVPPGVPIRYTYDLPVSGRRGPFQIEARLMFRSFPPFLVRAFAAYEREQARRGKRPSGPLVTDDMLRRLEVVEIARASAEIAR